MRVRRAVLDEAATKLGEAGLARALFGPLRTLQGRNVDKMKKYGLGNAKR